MANAPINVYSGQKLMPCQYPDEAQMTAVLLPPGSTIARGTVLGELSAQNEIQRIDIVNAGGGTFTATIGANTTPAQPYNVTAAALQTALRALASVGGANITVSGNPAGSLGPGSAGQYVVTYIGTMAGAAQPLITLASSLTGNNPLAFVERLRAGGASAAGVYSPYASGNTDGSQVAKVLAMYDTNVDAAGNVTLSTLPTQFGDDHGGMELSAPVWVSGWFRCEDLVGLDATAIGNLGRLVEGSATKGILRVM
jgi:hypothetical protein